MKMIQQKTCILCGATHEPMFYLKRQMIRGDGSKENIIQGNICADCNEMLEKIEMAVAVGFNNCTEYGKSTELRAESEKEEGK
jgi:hypothetical protein